MKDIWRVAYAGTAKWLPRSCYSKISRAIRAFFARRILAACGNHPNIERGATFGSLVKLGNSSNIGYMCELHGEVTIGDYVMMAPRVKIYTVNHRTDDIDTPMILQGNEPVRPVKIGDDCWIGDSAIILPGVEIGSHSIVGAGAVVTKSCKPYSVLGGGASSMCKNEVALNLPCRRSEMKAIHPPIYFHFGAQEWCEYLVPRQVCGALYPFHNLITMPYGVGGVA